MPYLNVTARIEGKEEDDLLEAKGGRGFPYCVLMNEKGEVVWEVRPDSEEEFTKGVEKATRLVGLQKKLAASPNDKGLEASVMLMEASGRNQREAPPLAKLQEWSKVEGVAPEAKTMAMGLIAKTRIRKAMQVQSREEAIENMYALMKEGVTPPEDAGGQIILNFYGFAAMGAVEAKDVARAKKAVAGFAAGVKTLPPRFQERLGAEVEKLEKMVKSLEDGAAEDGDDKSDK